MAPMRALKIFDSLNSHNKTYGKKRYGSGKDEEVAFKKDQKAACYKTQDAGKKSQ